jgi:arylformamidase
VLYDISPPLTESLKVWPGDTPLSREVLTDMRAGDNMTLSTLRSTVHAGAHADAPSHYGRTAPSIEERSLDYYLGPCQVVRVDVPFGTAIGPDALGLSIVAERVLIATGSFPDSTNFNEDFAALTAELIDRLHDRGVELIGIDTPSVDLFHSKDLPAHNACLRHDMAILEGLVLADVPEGTYELIALPLRLVGFDASPVRAVLRSLD